MHRTNPPLTESVSKKQSKSETGLPYLTKLIQGCHIGTQKAEARGLLQVQGQPGLQCDKLGYFVSKRKKEASWCRLLFPAFELKASLELQSEFRTPKKKNKKQRDRRKEGKKRKARSDRKKDKKNVS